MASLIIAVLAITLVAALSVIAVNYAGTVLNTAQADAQASELVGNAAKVASALRAWSLANGGSTTLTDTNWSNGAPTDLINSTNMYLDALPQLGSYAQGNGSSDYYIKTMPISNVAWANEGTNFTCLFAVITSIPVCQAIARLAGGDSGVPIYREGVSGSTMGDFSGTTGSYYNSVTMASYDFNCVVNDANSNGTIESSESMFFIYKVF